MMLPWIKRLDRRLGLIGKIGLVLAVGALLTAAVAATAWLSFNQVVGGCSVASSTTRCRHWRRSVR